MQKVQINLKDLRKNSFFGVFLWMLSLFVISTFMFSFSSAQQWHWGRYGDSPIEVLDNVAWDVSDEDGRIQQTALNDVSDTQWSYPYQYKISNTLESIRKNIAPYLDWLVYIWTAMAVILLIYNWIRLITWVISEFDHNKAIWNIKNLAIWLAVMWWFWALIKLTMIIINAIAGK